MKTSGAQVRNGTHRKLLHAIPDWNLLCLKELGQVSDDVVRHHDLRAELPAGYICYEIMRAASMCDV